MTLLRRLLPHMLILALFGVALLPTASASSIASGTFTADNSVFSYSFTASMPTTYTFSTTSFVSGGFLPVLTLFNSTSGMVVGYSDTSADADATLTDPLSIGSYVLYLTEFPNVAVGTLGQGFLLDQYSDGATYTGDTCGIAGGKFYDDLTCNQRTDAYALSLTTSTSASPTPEPASLVLLLAPLAFMIPVIRRRRQTVLGAL